MGNMTLWDPKVIASGGHTLTVWGGGKAYETARPTDKVGRRRTLSRSGHRGYRDWLARVQKGRGAEWDWHELIRNDTACACCMHDG